jgi:hypothetical protein
MTEWKDNIGKIMSLSDVLMEVGTNCSSNSPDIILK